MQDYKSVAIEAAREAGALLLELSKKEIHFSMKSSHDIQAEADLKSEELIINKIKAQFPEHSMLSEEAGEEQHNPEFLWVIDPVDGTINYSRGIEEYCVSIALQTKGELALGVVYQPVLDKLFAAERGKGAFLNDQKITVSSEKEFVNSIAATDNSSKLDTRLENFQILSRVSQDVRHVRIFGSGALHLARVAEGKIDFYFKTRFNYWDYASGVALIREAGGMATDFDGNPIAKNSKNIIASNGLLHQAALEAIAKH